MSKRVVAILGILLIASLVLAACPAPAPAPAAPAEGGEEAAGEMSFWAEAAKPYEGATIRGVSESTAPSNYIEEVLAPMFTAETGIDIEFEVTSWDEMYNKAIKDMEANTGIYDFIYIEQDIVYTYLARDFLVNLTQMLADNPELSSADFDTAKFTSWLEAFKDPETGDLYAVPMEAFIKTYLYRLDLFNDPEIQAAFAEEYGYDLVPATTHEQYVDMAKFFSAYGEENDLDLWGTAVQAHSGHASSTYELIESVMPTFGVYNWGVNIDTWKACVENGGEMNSDEAKAALTYWLGLLEYAPPEATSSTWDEVAASFAAGRAAQAMVYAENAAWIATDADRSAIVGNVGVAFPPLEEGVMEEAEAGEGYIGYYDGGGFGIPHSSKNKEAALLFLEFIGQESVQPEWAQAAARVVMNSTFSDPLIADMNTKVDDYYTKLDEWGPLFGGAPPFPMHPQIREAMNPFIWNAIAGEIPADEALDGACAAVEEAMMQLGYGE